MEESMQWPRSNPDSSERVLTKEEVEALEVTRVARELVKKTDSDEFAIDFQSEAVSVSEEAGYIFRYKNISLARVAEGKTGDAAVFAIFVVWSKDFKTARFASYPTYKLSPELEKYF